ncbi:MAG TPA: hypothetical protein VGS22_12915 [Thermoanaerobaculia bacterium]|jgi:hypothetical protein|nr:hypothetical protein [Thermoanaerobaculia bacterium]
MAADSVNLVLDDQIREEFPHHVPVGERNLFVNEALRARLNLLKRQRAVDQLGVLRRREPSVPTVEVAQALGATRPGTSEISRTTDSGELLARLKTRERIEPRESIADAIAADRSARLNTD